MHSFSILSEASAPKDCLIAQVPAPLIPKKWRISAGLPMGHHFPPNLIFQMDRGHPGQAIPDLVSNTERISIVSGKLKSLLEQHAAARIEFLPISIARANGRIVAKDYFIANVLDHVDCVDKARSEVEELNPDPTMLSGLFRLQVHSSQIPAEARLFRLKSMPPAVLIRDDLRAILDAASITGVKYITMGEECTIY